MTTVCRDITKIPFTTPEQIEAFISQHNHFYFGYVISLIHHLSVLNNLPQPVFTLYQNKGRHQLDIIIRDSEGDVFAFESVTVLF